MPGIQDRFSSRWGLIVSVLGIAIGTGNIWRFPRIAAQNGGESGAGAFLIAWIVFLFAWSIPLIIAEYAIGKNGRRGTIGSIITMAGEKFAWMGGFIGFVAMAIMFYYSVVTGWCIYYFYFITFSGLPSSASESLIVWNNFQESGFPVAFHALAIGLGAFVVLMGIRSIERVNKILIPSLLIILILSLLRAVTLDGSLKGIVFLFTPDWKTLTEPSIWLEALTQNAWDTGAGWGLILTYAAYMKMNQNITVSALQTGMTNNAISLLSAVIIFSTVFGTLGSSMSNSEILDVMKTSGPASTGLTFIWLPQLFSQMAGGTFFGSLFFLALSFAAFSSLISMIELSSKLFVDIGISRKRAAIGISLAGFILGIPSATNLTVFGNQDFVWGLGLMISGAFIIFVVIKYDVNIFRVNLINKGSSGIKSGKILEYVYKYVVPFEVIVLLGWWIYRSAFEFSPTTWYNPLDPYSVATCALQWGLVLSLLIMGNSYISKKYRLSSSYK